MKLAFDNGDEVVVDKVVVAAGIVPATALAESGRLEVDPVNGGFAVNSELLARSDIWVVCCPHSITALCLKYLSI